MPAGLALGKLTVNGTGAVTVSRRLPTTLLPVPDAIRNTIVCQFVTRLHILAWSHIQDVIAAGACTVVVPGAIPIGCEPELLTLYHTTGFRFFAECLRHSAKVKLHSAKPLPSVALSKEHTAKI